MNRMIWPSLLVAACLTFPTACPAQEGEPQLPATVQENVIGHRFARGNSTTFPIEICNHTIFVSARIDSLGPLWLVLDSGASVSSIDRALADSSGLKVWGQATGTGAGTDSFSVGFLKKNVVVHLPGLAITDQTLAVMDLSGLQAILGRAVHGILGADFFYNFVATLDYEHRKLIVAEPKSFHAPARAEVLPLEIKDDLPFVHGRLAVRGLAAQDVRLLVDTGSGDGVDHPLIQKSSGTLLKIPTGVGLGRESRGVVGRIDSLELGGLLIRGAPSACCGGSETSSALIGGRVLERFTPSFDYGSKRLFLVPNRHLADPFPSDASGLALRAEPGKSAIRVAWVIDGSPAKEAGIVADDLITTVDATPVSALTLDEIRFMLERPGQRHEFMIVRRGSPLRIEVTLRRLI